MLFTMQRDRTVTTLKGYSVEFKKGVPTHVPPLIYDEVLSQGAVPSEEIPEALIKKSVEVADSERKAAVFAAFDALVLTNDSADFTAGGSPHAKVVSAKAGFSVDAAERDDLWAAYKLPKE